VLNNIFISKLNTIFQYTFKLRAEYSRS